MAASPLPADMLKESLLRWTVLLGIAAADALWISLSGFHFVVHPLLGLFGINCLLLLLAWFFGLWRRESGLFVLLDTIAQMSILCATGATLSYLVLSTNQPPVDEQLSAIDKALGFDWPNFILWVQAHPTIDRGLQSIYAVSALEWLILPVLLAYRHEKSVRELIGIGMIALLFSILLSGLLPAVSAYPYYGPAHPEIATEVRMDDFFALRDGRLRTIDIEAMDGLITFPSFHAICALLFIHVTRSRPVLLSVILPFNAVVLVSTLSAGGHYLIDLIGGALVLAISAGIYRALTLHPDPASRPEHRLAAEGV